jgi:multidrug efflux pump subunit AcrB
MRQRGLERCAISRCATSNGNIVHLSDIASLVSTPTQVLITRNNRETVIHIGANIARVRDLERSERFHEARRRAEFAEP